MYPRICLILVWFGPREHKVLDVSSNRDYLDQVRIQFNIFRPIGTECAYIYWDYYPPYVDGLLGNGK